MGKPHLSILFTAPSGAGKTTFVKHLLSKYPEKTAFSISATTREKRFNELNGRDYYFLSKQEFIDKIIRGEFIEWEEVYEDQYYGSLKSEVDRLWDIGKIVIFDVDVKGATKIKEFLKEKCEAIFIAPPSFEVLYERLSKRGTESYESFQRRLERVKLEMEYRDNFDHVIVNDDLELALKEADQLFKSFISD